MPSDPLPANSWRPTASPQIPQQESASPRWRRETQAGGDGSRRSRRLRIAGLLAGFLVCMGLLIWASFWLFPPKPAALVLVGAGYETNLAVPHNVYGRESMRELAAWSSAKPPESFAWRSGLLRLKPEPIELQVGGAWDTALSRVNEKTVVLFFAMHGASDANGPYLIRQDADFRPSPDKPDRDRLRIKEILERLKKLPAKTNKVVILDATQVPAFWPLGVLHNDFARALQSKDFNAEIADVPNLVVLSASAPDQRSWTSDELRRTIFSYYVLEGLKGAADENKDGRVDARELFTYVNGAVERWVRANREALQTPVLLPTGEVGEKRARNIFLTMVPAPYQGADPSPKGTWTPPPELMKTWNTAQNLAQQTPSPEVYSPQIWQQYQATLLRYEQLLRLEDSDNAGILVRQLEDLERQIEQAKRVPLASATNTLTMPSLAGVSKKSPDVAKDFEALWAKDSDELASEWAKVQKKWPDDMAVRQSMRMKLLEKVFDPAIANAQENLEKAARIIELLNDPAVPRPAESHFLLMLGRYPAQRPPSTELSGLIGVALKLRLQAEQAALGLPSKGHPYSEPIRPWIAATIQQADQHRELGQDLLFVVDAARWATARKELLEAESLYTEAKKQADGLALAFAARDRLFAELPGFTRMIAQQRANDDATRQIEDLWRSAHALAKVLDGPTNLPLDAIRNLSRDAENAQKTFAALKARIESRLADVSKRNGLQDWYEIDAALTCPSWPAALRSDLLKNHGAIGDLLMRKTKDNALRTILPSAEAQQRQTLDQAQLQGRLALALLGEIAFDGDKSATSEKRADVAHRIETFRLEDRWWESLALAGETIGRRWQALPELAGGLASDSRQASLKDAHVSLQRADSLTRLLDGTSNARLSVNPAEEYRKLLLHDLLLWQAQRTFDEHWFAEDDASPRSKPYYQEAGRRYAEDARKMVSGAQTQAVTAMLAQLARTDRIVLAKIPPEVMTSEREVNVDYRIQPSEGTKFRPGFSVFRLQTGALLKTGFPGDAFAWVAELDPKLSAVKVPARITQNLSSLAVSSQKEIAQVRLRGFFRGQVLDEETPVELHPLASKVYYEYPLPLTRAVAVRTTPELQNLFGDGTGSLVIVLDCSGSMGSDPKDPMARTKFDDVTQALEQMIARLPRGTTVSLWVFGQAVGTGKTVATPEETIMRLLEPTAWNPEDPEQLPALMKKIHSLEPWNESPIVDAILAAKGDLDKAKGNKTIVVLTDGYDNRFTKTHEKAKLSIAAALRGAFQDSGIAVNVVGFKFDSKEEEDQARSQFRVLETLTPPGRFFATREVGKLAAELREATRQRLRYWIDREDNEKLPEVPDAGLELSAGGTDRWFQFPDSLPSGGYKMRVDTDRRLLQNIIINRGDLLLLNLGAGPRGLEWRRAFVTRDDYGDKPAESRGDWQLAVLQNQRVKDRGLQMLLMLDKAPERTEATLQELRPRETWIEVAPSQDATASFDLRWGYQGGYAAPAWNIESPNWPALRGAQTPAKPLVRMWWSPIQDTPPDAFVARSDELPTLYNATNITRMVEGEPVVIESIKVESQRVETQPGKFEDRSCLVVRVTHPKGKPVKVRVEGIAPSGQEHHYYPEAGKYTAIFWPVVEAQARAGLSRINLISINRFKSIAERNGHYIPLDRLNEPQPTDVRPRTPIEVKYE